MFCCKRWGYVCRMCVFAEPLLSAPLQHFSSSEHWGSADQCKQWQDCSTGPCVPEVWGRALHWGFVAVGHRGMPSRALGTHCIGVGSEVYMRCTTGPQSGGAERDRDGPQ